MMKSQKKMIVCVILAFLIVITLTLAGCDFLFPEDDDGYYYYYDDSSYYSGGGGGGGSSSSNICKSCNGSGRCSWCGGSGLNSSFKDGYCSTCQPRYGVKGTGKCGVCRGKGTI